MVTSTDGRRRPWLVIFLKEPCPGRVKTRLARDLGAVAASHWYRIHCQALVRRLSADPRWRTVLAVSPDREGMASRCWPVAVPRLAQGAGDLGVRMARMMRMLPPGPAAIIGSDIPGITPGRISRAFKLLGRNDAVFGPSPDGGYWLVGLRRTRAVSPGTFCNVRWSSEFTLADSRASLHCRSIGLSDTLQDVDTVSDLDRVRQRVVR